MATHTKLFLIFMVSFNYPYWKEIAWYYIVVKQEQSQSLLSQKSHCTNRSSETPFLPIIGITYQILGHGNTFPLYGRSRDWHVFPPAGRWTSSFPHVGCMYDQMPINPNSLVIPPNDLVLRAWLPWNQRWYFTCHYYKFHMLGQIITLAIVLLPVFVIYFLQPAQQL